MQNKSLRQNQSHWEADVFQCSHYFSLFRNEYYIKINRQRDKNVMHDESTQTRGCVSMATRDESECTVMLNMVRLLTQKHLWSKPREMGRDGPAGPVRCDSGRTRGTQRENQRDAHMWTNIHPVQQSERWRRFERKSGPIHTCYCFSEHLQPKTFNFNTQQH